MKQGVILDFLKRSGNKGFSQGEIARALMSDLRYSNEISARVSIGKLMKLLEKQGKAYYVSGKGKRGNLSMKVWKVTEEVPKQQQSDEIVEEYEEEDDGV